MFIISFSQSGDEPQATPCCAPIWETTLYAISLYCTHAYRSMHMRQAHSALNICRGYPISYIMYGSPSQYQHHPPHIDFRFLDLRVPFSLAQDPSVNSKMLHCPIQWFAMCFLDQRRGGGGLSNAVGLTVTSSAIETAGLSIKIKPPQRVPGLEATVYHGQAV